MFNNKFIFCFAFLLAVFNGAAQDCKLNISGQVIDEGTGLPLSYVNVLIREISNGTNTDDTGSFSFNNICEGEYHLIFSHIGCDSKEFHFDLLEDTFLNVILTHTSTSLEGVVIQGKKDNQNNQPNSSVNRQAIEDNTNQNLAGLLENQEGVHLIKNGSGISKPVVHGLYGNRLTILNNGIAQSGQQWGNDHSPEIDPFSADKIIVLKGANAIEFGSGNLGAVVLVEPKKIGREPHLHGQINYAYETNGRGNSLNARLERYTSLFAWRVNGTLKKYGDRKTASYFLNNTGLEEANLSFQLEKSWDEKVFFDFYASTFNTRLGVLRGSHIGNLTDLDQALNREIPFFTEPTFSYKIEAPKQHVSHHLVKFKTKYYYDESQTFDFVVAGQLNNRKEFDVRRSGREDLPALSLQQYTLNTELKYTKDFADIWKLKIGNQNIITDNTNNPETGILPLIPDYISFKNGIYSSLSRQGSKTDMSVGFRYDFENQNVVSITDEIPREIVRFENVFYNFGGVFTFKYNLSNTQSLTVNSGYAMRNPAVNELYSKGLHQGVSGIEEGDVNLKTETAIKNTLEYKWLPNANFSFNTLVYYQHFNDYIFLNPQDEVRLTIRGAFPLFIYEQTDAAIYGLDLSTQFMLGKSFLALLKYSYIKGEDRKNDLPLVYMPPNSLSGSLTFRSNKAIKLFTKLKLEELEITVNNKLVFEQSNLLPEQDFVAPPPTYHLVGLKFSSNLTLPKYKFRFFTKVENLLNSKYRDYLNRQRYFADETGRSFTMGLNFKF